MSPYSPAGFQSAAGRICGCCSVLGAIGNANDTGRARPPALSHDNQRVTALARTWMLAARLRRRARGRDAALPPYPEIYLPYARDRSFADIGTMWSVNGRYAFEAEAGGASKVTAVDVMVPTEEFERELARRGSEVRFVRADITQRESLAAVGTHEVVWCSGVVYHQPNPL